MKTCLGNFQKPIEGAIPRIAPFLFPPTPVSSPHHNKKTHHASKIVQPGNRTPVQPPQPGPKSVHSTQSNWVLPTRP